MANKKRIYRDDILKASVLVLKQLGETNLTTRNIAKQLNVSTQPIYSEFQNIDDLKQSLVDYITVNYLKEKVNNYKHYALKLLNFARNEKQLFLFMYVRQRQNNLFIDDANYDDIISSLSNNLEMDIDKVKEMHKKMQYYCYSLGVMIASNYLDLSEQDLDKELSEIFKILLKYYKNISSEEEFKYWLHKSHHLM